MNAAILQNILIFLERAPGTGKECLAWTETYQAVQAALAVANTPVPAAPLVTPTRSTCCGDASHGCMGNP